MGPMPVAELLLLMRGVPQMAFTHRSMTAFMRGMRMPASARTSSMSAGNFPSRSRIR